MPKPLIGLLTPQDIYEKEYKTLLETQCDVIYGKSVNRYPDYKYTTEELLDYFGNCDGIIVGGRDRVPKDFIENAPKLKVITKSSIGVEKIDIKTASENTILVTNAPIPHNFISVAEGTITLMLSVLKRVFELDQMTRNGQWRNYDILPNLLYTKKIGIIGFGRIGKAVVERLKGWGVELYVYDPYVPDQVIKDAGVINLALEDLLKTCDVISIHVVLTHETHHLLNKDRLNRMKADSIIVNTSRGGVIDEESLLECLKSKRIAAAGLDVFENEPAVASNPLFGLDNVVVTPHCISLTSENLRHLTLTAIDECTNAIHGNTPKYIVNSEIIERWKKRISIY
ncbi:NAD(P)-dependent oxidoreductase [Bacillus sp. Marseille-P3661]|uniref:NAD(P)-dependent oxidoreductase n=1 Tax=Bacillus sp. Marseille-P3661 TaxID=1936234 RepID=UPI000C81B7C3|nr:NAD(P)-dependent oxidoreductase [Bacillus sp. Marseille-P3661]